MNFQVYRELFLLGLGSDIALLFCAAGISKKAVRVCVSYCIVVVVAVVSLVLFLDFSILSSSSKVKILTEYFLKNFPLHF